MNSSSSLPFSISKFFLIIIISCVILVALVSIILHDRFLFADKKSTSSSLSYSPPSPSSSSSVNRNRNYLNQYQHLKTASTTIEGVSISSTSSPENNNHKESDDTTNQETKDKKHQRVLLATAQNNNNDHNSDDKNYYYSKLPPHPDYLLAKRRVQKANGERQRQPLRSYSRLVAVDATAPDLAYSQNATLVQCLRLCDRHPKCNYVVRNVSFVNSAAAAGGIGEGINSHHQQQHHSRGPAPCWLKLAVVLNTQPDFYRETWVVSRAPQPRIAIGVLSAPKFVGTRLSAAYATWLKNEDSIVLLENTDEAKSSVKKYFGATASQGRPAFNARASSFLKKNNNKQSSLSSSSPTPPATSSGPRVMFLFEDEDKESHPGSWKNLVLMKKLPAAYKMMMGSKLERYEKSAQLMMNHPKNSNQFTKNIKKQISQFQTATTGSKTTTITTMTTTKLSIQQKEENEQEVDFMKLVAEEEEESSTKMSTTTQLNSKKQDSSFSPIIKNENDQDNDDNRTQDPNEPDWYFIVDDDSFVLMRTLRFALAVSLPYEPSYTGLNMVAADYTKGHPFIQGGAGIVLSQHTFAKTFVKLDCCIDLCKQKYGDFRTGCCVVQAAKLTPTLHKGFYSYSPWENAGTDMRKKYGYPMFPISFHRVRTVKMMFSFQEHIDQYLLSSSSTGQQGQQQQQNSNSALSTSNKISQLYGSKYRMVPRDQQYSKLRNSIFGTPNKKNNTKIKISSSVDNSILLYGIIPQNRREWAFVDDLVPQRMMRNLKKMMVMNSTLPPNVSRNTTA